MTEPAESASGSAVRQRAAFDRRFGVCDMHAIPCDQRHPPEWDSLSPDEYCESCLARLTVTALEGQLAALREEIAAAREACPAVRMQDNFDAPLLSLIEQEVSQLFRMQSRAEVAEANVAALREERDALLKRLKPAVWQAAAQKTERERDALLVERDAAQAWAREQSLEERDLRATLAAAQQAHGALRELIATWRKLAGDSVGMPAIYGSGLEAAFLRCATELEAALAAAAAPAQELGE